MFRSLWSCLPPHAPVVCHSRATLGKPDGTVGRCLAARGIHVPALQNSDPTAPTSAHSFGEERKVQSSRIALSC